VGGHHDDGDIRLSRYTAPVLALAALLASGSVSDRVALAAPSFISADRSSCSIDSGDTGVGGTAGVIVGGVCIPITTHSSDPAGGQSAGNGRGEPAVVTRHVDCGHIATEPGGITKWDCTGSPKACSRPNPDVPGGLLPVETMGTEQQDPSDPTTWTLISTWCPTEAPPPPPMPTTAQLRDEVIRLLPHVPVGWIGPHLSLVNVQEILWTPTTNERNLGTVTIVGRPVALRIRLAHTNWTFGDGTTDTTTDLGQPYDQTHPCPTKQCPGYYGHTYTTAGPHTIGLSVTWTADFSLDGGTTWTTIAGGPITGPTANATITLKQARAILVK
jgi:hypothetical protein